MIVGKLRELLGDPGILVDPGDLAAYRHDSVHRAEGGIVCVARPADTGQVSRVVSACRAAGVALVPRGGGTGFAGGALPLPGQDAVVLSLGRMRRIRSIDTVSDVMVAEAGCTLHELQRAALDANRLLGLDHGGAGSSSIGGNVATNAGGNNVVRYGMARQQVLGIEAVLADGSVLGPPSVLRKSNAGYDLCSLIAGSEGTLAIVTAVALGLRPAPVASATAVLGVESPQQALDLFRLAREMLGEAVSAFELMSRPALEFHFSHASERREPLARPVPWLVLLEAESTSRFMDLDAAFESLLDRSMEAGLVLDGSLASSLAQRRSMWALREGIAVAMGEATFHIVKTDTAVPVASSPEFIRRVGAELGQRLPGCVPMAFGHVGDGNIHLNVLPPPGMSDAEFRGRSAELSRAVEDIALALHGTVSAEHGIGQGKRDALARMLSPAAMGIMQAIKHAFDPAATLNPGKLFDRPTT
ncbi:MAG: FAD-binding oxidoreductase [Burkholderiaceae bacterium]|nr:FAD-binding oxidoreductase [Burkholderiaceae bacterium]MEB2350631.1 FAD-binding oxidoreductase [Burkholderiaceae bacterium]